MRIRYMCVYLGGSNMTVNNEMLYPTIIDTIQAACKIEGFMLFFTDLSKLKNV